MQTKGPLPLRVFQWTLWLLMLGLIVYAFAPGIIDRLAGNHDARIAAPSASVNQEAPE